MEFDLYNQGKELLRSEDNLEWINKITCWVKKEKKYNIYVFQIIVENQEEIERYYKTITASIAVDFQSGLDKMIEKWNIYTIFECKKDIDLEIKMEIEQDKYATRKIVWDNLKEEELNSREYIIEHLFSLKIKENMVGTNDNKDDLLKQIEREDLKLYEILENNNLTLEKKEAIYMKDENHE